MAVQDFGLDAVKLGDPAQGWCLPRPLSEESAPTRIFQVQDTVRTRRTTLGRSTAARPRR